MTIGRRFARVAVHVVLMVAAILAVYPVLLMVLSSFKSTMDILRNPFAFPTSINLEGYIRVWRVARFDIFLRNSIVTTGISIALILIIAVLAAHVLARYKFRGRTIITLYLLLGIMLPIKLATVYLFILVRSLGLYDSLVALVLIYVASHLSVSIYILKAYIESLPGEFYEAARIDGCSNIGIIRHVTVPLIRPALATAAIYNFIPIWNDLWFPLIFIRTESRKTVQQGLALFFGQYQTDWVAVFSALTLTALPIMTFYLLMSRQFIRGLTAGAFK